MPLFPVSALTYQSEFYRLTGNKFWLNSRNILKKFQQLDSKLATLNINPEQYVKISIVLWDGWLEDSKIIPIDLLCGDAAIQRYIETDPINQEDYLAGVLYELALLKAAAELEHADTDKIVEFLNERALVLCDYTYQQLQQKYPKQLEQAIKEAFHDISVMRNRHHVTQ